MKKRIYRNLLSRSLGIIAAALLLILAGTAMTWAQSWHNIPGTACGAYNNNQANELERSHVRLLNPITNTRNIWVICPAQRVYSDVGTIGDGNPNGFLDIFFGTGATQDVMCIVREFNWASVHIPGGDADATNTLNSETVTVSPPMTLPGVPDFQTFSMTTDTADNPWTYITITCNLQPGTGINAIDLLLQ